MKITRLQLQKIIKEYYKSYEETLEDYEEGEAIPDELDHAESRWKRDQWQMMREPPIGKKEKRKSRYISKRERRQNHPDQYKLPFKK